MAQRGRDRSSLSPSSQSQHKHQPNNLSIAQFSIFPLFYQRKPANPSSSYSGLSIIMTIWRFRVCLHILLPKCVLEKSFSFFADCVSVLNTMELIYLPPFCFLCSVHYYVGGMNSSSHKEQPRPSYLIARLFGPRRRFYILSMPGKVSTRELFFILYSDKR